MNSVKFYGIDILRYYYYLYQNSFADYSWQIKTAYCIVILSIVMLLFMLFYFIWQYYKKQKYKQKLKKITEQYSEKIETLLYDESLTSEYIISEIKNNIDIKGNSLYFIQILINARFKKSDKEYFKNMQIIVTELGIREYIENMLLTNTDVFNTLQCLVMLQIEISEGRLANYTHSKNKYIRTFARIAYMYCSNNDPYKFLYDELDYQDNLLNSMLLHYVFNWMYTQGKILPNFLNLANTLHNDETSAFILNESTYYNIKLDINDLMPFYNNKDKVRTKEVAINLSLNLNYDDIYEPLMNIYPNENEFIKKAIIITLSKTGNSKFINTLQDIYKNSVSRPIKETILINLIKINASAKDDISGINAFKHLEYDMEKDILLFNNVEGLFALEQLKEYNRQNEND